MAPVISSEKRGRGVISGCAPIVTLEGVDYLLFYPVGEKIGKPAASRGYPVIVIGPVADSTSGYCYNGNPRQGS